MLFFCVKTLSDQIIKNTYDLFSSLYLRNPKE